MQDPKEYLEKSALVGKYAKRSSFSDQLQFSLQGYRRASLLVPYLSQPIEVRLWYSAKGELQTELVLAIPTRTTSRHPGSTVHTWIVLPTIEMFDDCLKQWIAEYVSKITGLR